ncbi:hypothetical protein [Halobacillus halophilus]|uniref:hypothetical protein n=1 Tax=Halobacillus halophilus TaxID=1570 RepID=UPI001CD5F69B|nr:hypothetical protein [Halobacillus halophilus]MCA1010745.1 hypothetical protein [Halobacillus halophilus]
MGKWKLILYPVICGLLGGMVSYILNGFEVDGPSFIGIFIGSTIGQLGFMLWRKEHYRHSDRR